MKSSNWLVLSLWFLGSDLVSPAAPPSPTTQVNPSAPFRFAPVTENSLGLWEGTRPVFVYNHGTIQNTNTPGKQGHSTYLHPIYGLDGEVLTDDFPKDHVYHRGLYWAWPHIKIADQEYDLWSLRGIRSEFRRWLTRDTSARRAVLAVENAWRANDKDVMTETVRLEIHPASDHGRAIDVELTWTPIGQAVSLSGAPEKSYGGLTLRFGPRSKPIITVPTGRTTDDLLMTRLPWADFCSDFGKDTNVLSGMAIFVDPNHADYPPTWMTRHYGVLAVGWPGVTPQTFPAGKSFSCRYRLWIHRNVLGSGEIQKVYDAYRADLR
jgi:hypothetical protein